MSGHGYHTSPQDTSLPPITSAQEGAGLPAALGLSTSLPTSLHHQTRTHHNIHQPVHPHSYPHQSSAAIVSGSAAPTAGPSSVEAQTAARVRTLQDLHDSTTSASLRHMYSTIMGDYNSGRIVWRAGSGYLYSTAGVLLMGPLPERELKNKIVELFSAGVYDVYTELCDGEPIAHIASAEGMPPCSRL
ncbi:hypothetical protein ABW21_db0204454 [Orbilia brochopaga]|nr:hypothetical protein ABW21_db0204454 [Drechslerella brochopaga]